MIGVGGDIAEICEIGLLVGVLASVDFVACYGGAVVVRRRIPA